MFSVSLKLCAMLFGHIGLYFYLFIENKSFQKTQVVAPLSLPTPFHMYMSEAFLWENQIFYVL